MATFKSHKGKTVCVNGGLVSFKSETLTTECKVTIAALSKAIGVEELKSQPSKAKPEPKNKAG